MPATTLDPDGEAEAWSALEQLTADDNYGVIAYIDADEVWTTSDDDAADGGAGGRPRRRGQPRRRALRLPQRPRHLQRQQARIDRDQFMDAWADSGHQAPASPTSRPPAVSRRSGTADRRSTTRCSRRDDAVPPPDRRPATTTASTPDGTGAATGSSPLDLSLETTGAQPWESSPDLDLLTAVLPGLRVAILPVVLAAGAVVAVAASAPAALTGAVVHGPMTDLIVGPAQRLAAVPGPVGETGRQVVAGLDEPVRVGVVGRVSAGKSTLVNALLGMPVAPTGAGETTTIPCWFRSGRYSTAEVVAGDGRTAVLPLLGDHLPEQLPAQFDVEGDTDLRIEVRMPAQVLRSLHLVDTPGVASTDERRSGRTASLLTHATGRSAELVEALVVVITGTPRPQDVTSIGDLVAGVPSVGPVPVVAALTRVDALDDDLLVALARGRDLAAHIADAFAGTVDAVVPVAGLLAETSATGALTETDVRDLRRLAEDLDPEAGALAAADVRILLALPTSVPVERRRALVARLGLAGLGWAIEQVRADPGLDAGRLCDRIAALAGADELVATLTRLLRERADTVKASTALALLERVVDDPAVPDEVADEINRVVRDPQLFPLALWRAVRQLTASRTPLPQALQEHVARVRRDGQAALAGSGSDAGAWQQWALLADGPGRRAAEVLVRGHHLVAAGGGRS